MANYIATDTDLEVVADAIRAKGGTSAQLLFPSGFANAIAAIDTSGGGGGGYTAGDWLDPTKPTGAVVSNTISIPAHALQGRTGVTSVSLPNATSMGANSFYGCTALISVSMHSLCVLNETSGFYGCSNLAILDCGGQGDNPRFSSTYILRNCTKLKTLILRNTSAWSLSNINVFQGSPFASNGTGGTLYVPSALISSYQSATNWSTILGYANNQILSIEGSIYETQYADGTPIS